MSQRTALLVATALTVFVMIMMVGVVWQVFQKSNVDALALEAAVPSQAAETVGALEANSGPSAQEQEQIAQREAAFQKLIQDANQRIEQANKAQQDLSKQLQAEKQKQAANERAVASQQPKYNVSPEQAANIALETEKGAVLVKPPELVSFHETAAYEVTLDRGVVYVDANTGQVLYNSAAVIVIRDSGGGNVGGGGPSSASSGGGEHHDEHEHEDEHQHEDEHEHEDD